VIYLDYHATTPVDPRVLEAMLPFFTERFGNPHSKQHAFGWDARDATDKARAQVAALINATAGEITFTGGATESSNLALKGAVAALRSRGNHIVTVATDGSALYDSERVRTLRRDFGGDFDESAARRVFAEHLGSITTEHMIDCTDSDRRRIFNLGYYTWVEQQGVSLSDFDARRDQSFWRSIRSFVPAWDDAIREFNARTGLS
jgi:hypothetical protein